MNELSNLIARKAIIEFISKSTGHRTEKNVTTKYLYKSRNKIREFYFLIFLIETRYSWDHNKTEQIKL